MQILHFLHLPAKLVKEWAKSPSKYLGQSTALPMHVLGFRYVTPFRNHNAENRGQI